IPPALRAGARVALALERNVFGIGREAAEIVDPERRRRVQVAVLVMAVEADVRDRQPHPPASLCWGCGGARRVLVRRRWLRPLVATATAGRGVERVNLGTLRTRLGTYACRCDGGFAPATDFDVDLVHRPVPPTVAGEV